MFKKLLLSLALMVSFQAFAFPVDTTHLPLQLNQPQVSTGLVSYYLSIPTRGLYSVLASATFQVGSSLAILVYRGSLSQTLYYTAPTVGQSQTGLQFKAPINAEAGEVIKITLSSLGSSDNQMNTVKTTAAVQQGL